MRNCKNQQNGTGNLYVSNHPLILDKLTRIRDKNVQKKEFQEKLNDVASLMAYEIFEDLEVKDVEVETPVTKTVGKALAKQIILCPILRAGLGMVTSFERLLPDSTISHIGLYRDEKTLQPQEYFFKWPNLSDNSEVLVYILDPMLATGGSALAAIKKIKSIGVKNIVLVALVGVEQAVKKIHDYDENIKIYLASLDEKLNEHGYIVPGLGDAGDRIFGTK